MSSLCRACKQPIESGATRCPKCQSFQVWWRNPQFFSLIFIVPLVFIMPLITMRKAFNRPVYSGQITLAVNTQTITTFPSPEYNQGRKSTVIILGQANNTSEIKWGNPSYEVVILDAQGKTIDTVAAAEYNQVFLPNSKSPFRISFDSIADKRNIAKVEVKIKDAMEK